MAGALWLGCTEGATWDVASGSDVNTISGLASGGWGRQPPRVRLGVAYGLGSMLGKAYGGVAYAIATSRFVRGSSFVFMPSIMLGY